jgi:hypothetical protein
MWLTLAASVCAALYLLLWLVTGFDPITTFRVIEHEQTMALVDLARPFPRYLFDDVIDFAMASGWIGFLLAAMYFIRAGRDGIVGRTPAQRLALVAVLQIAIVAAAGLLPGESTRLWMLLLPALMAPTALELAAWSPRARFVTYGCLWLILAVIAQNMTFIYLGPELDGPRWTQKDVSRLK